MDDAKLKDGLRTAMSISSDCNKFVTDNGVWSAEIDPERRRVVCAVLMNSIRVLAALYDLFHLASSLSCLTLLQSSISSWD